MPIFKYTILDPKGHKIHEEIAAESRSAAAAALRRQGKFVVDVEESGAAAKTGGSGLNAEVDLGAVMGLFSWTRGKDLVLMLRQFAVLLDSGVSIVQSLLILERQTDKRALKRLVKNLRLSVESGQSLSQAMSENRRVFSVYVINMIKAAETSGELDMTMTRIADELETAMAFKRRLITAMIYPAMVLIMTCVSVAVITLVVLPKFTPLLEGAGRSLPWSTLFLMDASDWARAHAPKVFGATVGAIVLAVLLRKTKEGQYLIDMLLLRIPVIGPILKCGVVVGFSSNLSTLFAGGVPVSDALETVQKTIKNRVAAGVVGRMVKRVREGESISAPLREATGIFPPMVAEMVATGEETGEMVKVLRLASDIHRQILTTKVARMNTIIEPLIIVILGGIVGFVFYGLISGMLAMYGV